MADGAPNTGPVAGFVCALPVKVDVVVAASSLLPNINVGVEMDAPNAVLPKTAVDLAASPALPSTGVAEPSTGLNPGPPPNENTLPEAGDPAGVVENGLLDGVLLPNARVGFGIDVDESPPAVASCPNTLVDKDDPNAGLPKTDDAPEDLVVSSFELAVAPKTGTGADVEDPSVGAVDGWPNLNAVGFGWEVEVALALAVEVEAGANAEFVDGFPNEKLGAEGGVLAGAVEDAPENEKSGAGGFELSEGTAVVVAEAGVFLVAASIEPKAGIGAAGVGAELEVPVFEAAQKIDSCGFAVEGAAESADGDNVDGAVLSLANENGEGLGTVSVSEGWVWQRQASRRNLVLKVMK
jgi:hypothetical protein